MSRNLPLCNIAPIIHPIPRPISPCRYTAIYCLLSPSHYISCIITIAIPPSLLHPNFIWSLVSDYTHLCSLVSLCSETGNFMPQNFSSLKMPQNQFTYGYMHSPASYSLNRPNLALFSLKTLSKRLLS